MAYEMKPGQITVFRNERKEKDTHPDYNIECLTPDGEKLRGALWAKESKNGKTYLSGKLEVPREDGAKVGGSTKAYTPKQDLEDEIPF